MIRALLALGLAGTAWCATADDLLAQVAESLSAADRRDPQAGARVDALAAVIGTPGLSPADRRRLRLALAEACLEARRWDQAQTEAAAVAAEAPEPERERALLAWLAAWEGRGGTEDPVAALAALGRTEPRLTARALVLRSRQALAAGQRTALVDLDAALAALAAAPPEERVPLYDLRITAMEALGADPAAVEAWLGTRAQDPALVLRQGGASRSGLGQPAPALVQPRRDGREGAIDLASFRGRAVVVAFVATWSDACATLPAQMPPTQPVIWVVLDGPETVAGVPAWVERRGVRGPVIGEGRGWDGDLDEAWGVEAIPTLVLVDAEGRMAAKGTPEQILPRLAGAPRKIDEVLP